MSKINKRDFKTNNEKQENSNEQQNKLFELSCKYKFIDYSGNLLEEGINLISKDCKDLEVIKLYSDFSEVEL